MLHVSNMPREAYTASQQRLLTPTHTHRSSSATMFDGTLVHDVTFGLGDDELVDVADTDYPSRGMSGESQ